VYPNVTESARIARARVELQSQGLVTAVMAVLGPELFRVVHEEPGSQQGREVALWRMRTPASLPHFRRRLAAVNSAVTFPLLHIFAREERRLAVIRYMADVLAWHRVCFNALRGTGLSREAAGSMSNEEVVALLPADARDEAMAVLDAYAEAFNASFPLVTNLYECQANPFLGFDGQVDLSGTKVQKERMGRSTPVAFSLPSSVPGETDAQGLCTIQLLNMMLAAHNDVLQALTDAGQRPDTAGKQAAGPAAAVAVGQEYAELPVTNFTSSPDILRRQLINYSRERDLLPLLSSMMKQDTAFGNGHMLEYELNRIQDCLSHRLLAGRVPINLQIRHFSYAGELRRTGRLGLLLQRIPQVELPASVRAAIGDETDTLHRLTRLSNVVEDAVGFLTSVGGGNVRGIDGEMPLAKYIQEVLLIPVAEWEHVATPTVTNAVRLKHLQSLVVCLEELQQGDVTDRVASAYTEPLPKAVRDSLMASVGQVDLGVFLPILREFMTSQLTTPSWPTDAPLKEYLGYSTDHPAMDEPGGWFETAIPEELMLAHTVEVFKLLSTVGGH